ncbi:MAG: M61 family metallopeptidase [Ignavibacteriae bacterium]|nr:M61 family metallopeptidase [Ignavibacteriota bacterium]MCB9216631.1 M61 family metallopeptidase [Ignavibacteria bacterium]
MSIQSGNRLVPTLLLSLFVFTTSSNLWGQQIHYDVSIPDPISEIFSVTADLQGVTPDTLTFYFPVWAPGAYDVVNYGHFVSAFAAQDKQGKALQVIQVDSSTYRIAKPSKEMRISYRVHDIEQLEQSPWFGLSDIEDSTRVVFATGTALFGYPDGFKDIPYTVTYTPPQEWNLAVALDPVKGKANTFSADSYDELADAPVQMGGFQQWEFSVNGIPHTVTVTAPAIVSEEAGEKLVETTKEVVQLYSQFFGEMPYDRYLFQYYFKTPSADDVGYGALEHANSSTYQMPWIGEEYLSQMMQPVISHEYWHLWSPKRFHVDALGPFDYQHLPETESLWFHEGLTEYYARLLLLRNKLRDPSDFFNTFSGHVVSLYGIRQDEPITTLSRELPHRPLEDIISLYTKGPVLGLMLDAEIRLQTDNRKSLDDAMIYFNKEYGDHTGGKNFDDHDIIPIIEKATGAKLQEFYQNYISGTEPLPFDEIFPKIGLKVVLVPELGIRLTRSMEGWKVRNVTKEGSAERGGLLKNDVITAVQVDGGEWQLINDLELQPMRFSIWLSQIGGDKVTFRVTRGESVEELQVELDNRRFGGFLPNREASGKALELRQSMLGL